MSFPGFGHWLIAMDEVAADRQHTWGCGTGVVQRGYLLDGGALAVEGAARRTGVLEGDMARHHRNERSDALDDQGIRGTTLSAE